MQRHQHRFHLPALSRGYLGKPTTALVFFASVMFLILLGDAIMAYFAPVYIEAHLHNTFWTGIILSTSSVVGFITDIFLGEWFKHKPLTRFIFWAGILALIYPLTFLALPPVLPIFFLSMAIWGIYYELLLFSKFNFINHFLPHHQHELGWTIIGTFNDLAYMIGPIIAGLFIAQSFALSLTTAFSFTCIGLFGFIIFKKTYYRRLQLHSISAASPVDFKEELMVWRLLLPRIWPVMLLIFILTAFDATMWSIGAILSENLIKQELPVAEALFIAYLLPSMFMGYIAMNLSGLWGKKRTAFIFAIFGGLIYILSGFMPTAFSFVGVVFLAAMCTAIVWPEIRSVVEDYIERLGIQGNLMISLGNSTTSLAYVFGSVFAGLWGKKRTAFIFAIFGGLIYILSGFMPTAFGFVGVVFLAAMCTAIVWPEIRSVVEDYIERLGIQGNLMISLGNSTTSLAYVFGSVFAGFIATQVGEQKTFSVMGGLLVLVALIGLFVMPKKVRLPQQKLRSLK